jgi:glycosyltransferase involved in cell wall biosynthesis
MRIGIDARFFGPRVGGGGIGRYVEELVTNLQELDHQNEYVLFLKRENFHACRIVNSRFRKEMVDVHWYGAKEQLVLPRHIARARLDFMHFPHWNVPILSRTPFLATIHDLIMLRQKKSARVSTRGPIVHGIKHLGYRLALEHAVHRSRHLISVSQYTKDSILKHFRVSDKKVSVVHNGVKAPSDGKGVDLSSLGVYSPYFLYVGNAYPHKNLEMLLHTFSRFAEERPFVQLVIAGRRDIFSRNLEREANEIGLGPERIRFVDLPSDDEISALYRACSLFIYPSRDEGFGMPPLEAMLAGAPVAAAHSASIPEVLKDHAQYFHPDDIEALLRIMHAASVQPDRLRAESEKHAAFAKRYDWKRCAEETLTIYQNFPLY